MEYQQSSACSSPSRRGSHVETIHRGISPHPKALRFQALSRFSIEANSPRERLGSRHHGSAEEENNEQSPLLSSHGSDELEQISHLRSVLSPNGSSGGSMWNAETSTSADEVSRSTWYLFLLTISLGGLQLAWAVELSNGSPYLLSLGISKSLLAVVWIAGPLSGTFVQPYVGMKSDRCRSRYGRRRPFMIGGAAATVISLMALAWTRELIGAILSVFGIARDSQTFKTTAIVFAIAMIYVLDFSINVIQAGIRAFIVDNAPTHQQDPANAWASRVSNAGNIIGYVFGYIDLPKYFWFLGHTQFKVLCAIASTGLLITLAVSCFSISEQDSRLNGNSRKDQGGTFILFKILFRSIRRLPQQISRVCQVQLAAWIGWFPFLFYATTYIGEIYVDPIFRANPKMTEDEIDETWAHGTRIGTFALMMFAITSFAASVILPWFIVDLYKPIDPPVRTAMTTGVTAPAESEFESVNDYFPTQNPATSGPISSKSPFANGHRSLRYRIFSHTSANLALPGFTLRRAWLLSHIVFALLMWLTFAARNTTAATVLVAFVGIPWALTMWAPFALIAAELSKREKLKHRRRHMHLPGDTPDQEEEEVSEAGLVLGIHNVAIAAPQVVATLISSAVFKALQKPRGVAGDGSVAWVLRFGGVCALVAAALTMRVAEENANDDSRAQGV